MLIGTLLVSIGNSKVAVAGQQYCYANIVLYLLSVHWYNYYNRVYYLLHYRMSPYYPELVRRKPNQTIPEAVAYLAFYMLLNFSRLSHVAGERKRYWFRVEGELLLRVSPFTEGWTYIERFLVPHLLCSTHFDHILMYSALLSGDLSICGHQIIWWSCNIIGTKKTSIPRAFITVFPNNFLMFLINYRTLSVNVHIYNWHS